MIRFWDRHGEKADPESLFLAHLEFIDRAARSVALRHGYGPAEADDFCSHVKGKLLENDYGVLRKFQGKSSLRLYLKTVIRRLYIDCEIAQKGKWRPSIVAQRMGPVAVQLEQLLFWKRHTFEEAYEILNSRHGTDLQRDELQDIVNKLPKRWGKRTVKFLSLDSTGMPEPVSEKEFPDPKLPERTKLLSEVLKDFIDRLSGADRLILKMRFQDDFTYERIAGFLKKKKMQVYWRLRKILADLQEELVARGLSEATVGEILELEGKKIDIDFVMQDETEQS